jgi:hypothetical protein
MRSKSVILTLLLLITVPVLTLKAGEKGPWPAEVPGWTAPKAGEHPRLFFRRSDIPALRKRAETAEGKAITARLKVLLGGGEAMPEHKRTSETGKTDLPVGAYTMSHAAGFGLLYQITGEKRYADLGKECFEWALNGIRDRDTSSRYSFKAPNGALRAGPSLGWYAVGYDLCYDGWDENYRRKIALAIQNYNEGKFMSLAELARGARHMPASNHWGMQVGGAALALLAIKGDPGVDSDTVDKLLEQNAKSMIRNLTEGFGDHGFFPEGDGTGSMSSHIVFASALNAWKTAGGKDFISPRPNAPWMTLKWIFLTIPRNGKLDCPKRGAYPHNVWQRDGLSGAGYFAQGFGAVTQGQKAALLWFYNYHLKEADAKAGTAFDTPSVYPHNAVLSFINWPFGTKQRNPAEVIPRAVCDKKWGFYMFRNRWQDENDIVISIQTRNTRGWHKASTKGDVTIYGLGKKTKWGRLRTDIKHFEPYVDGSAILSGADGTCLAIDFSKRTGAEAMLVMTGPGAPGDNRISAGGTEFSFKFLTAGTEPTPKIEGDKIVIGNQIISFDDNKITLRKR